LEFDVCKTSNIKVFIRKSNIKNIIRKKFMKQLKTLTVLIFSLSFLFFSCNNKSSAGNRGKDSVSDNGGTSGASSNGDASFSCMLDGKEFSGSGTDENINAAFHLKGDDKGQIFFRLSDLKEPGEKLMFQVPGKEGSTTFSVTPTFSYMGYITKGYINYLDNPLTVTITSLNAARVKGTFSGKYTISEGFIDTNAKKTIEVTDGKFDIPFSASADWKKFYNAG
jgi:hypothetical protein